MMLTDFGRSVFANVNALEVYTVRKHERKSAAKATSRRNWKAVLYILSNRLIRFGKIPGRPCRQFVLNLVCPGGHVSRTFRLPDTSRACSPARWSRRPFKEHWLNNTPGNHKRPRVISFLPDPQSILSSAWTYSVFSKISPIFSSNCASLVVLTR